MESLVAEEVGEGPIVERIKQRIQQIYGPRDSKIADISLDKFVVERLEVLKPKFPHRELEIVTNPEPVPDVCVPADVMEKVVDGLLRNAVEATPDEGKIEIEVRKKGDGSELVVRDYGIGITNENQRRIFLGFFTTHETMFSLVFAVE